MNIEEEVAELKAELIRQNENASILQYATSSEYRALLNKNTQKVCEICGKEYKLTHLCETTWKFEWDEFWKHFNAYQKAKKNNIENLPVSQGSQGVGSISNKSHQIQPYQPQSTPKKKNNNCVACICIIIAVIFIIFFF